MLDEHLHPQEIFLQEHVNYEEDSINQLSRQLLLKLNFVTAARLRSHDFQTYCFALSMTNSRCGGVRLSNCSGENLAV